MLKSNSAHLPRDRPIFSQPGLAIWVRHDLAASAPDFSLKLEEDFGSGFFEGASRQAPLYLKAYSQVSNGPKLSADQVATMVRGGSVQAEFQSAKNASAGYSAFLSVSELQKVPWKSRADRHDLLLRFGRAFPMEKTEDGERRQWGWEIDQIIFPKRLKHGTDVFPFEPSHAFQCLKLGQCHLHAYRIVYAGALKKDESSLPSAKLQISLLREDVIPSSPSKISTLNHE